MVTRGQHKSVASNGAEFAETGIVPVTVVGKAGVADTFTADFVARRLVGGSLQAALEAGRDAAAITCTHIGCFRKI
ncbi:hypothetical protein J5288_28825 [Agrobacterium sp. S2/73]|uniref:hypothetical protein n=1 Tax=Rhizobium/Agrobacterium group TaxID=227290 RepID=UPI001ADD5A4E|nr:hypothetical protein [Agrobacterium sp. S2/73]QXZ76148.1 hypothetical protein J5276_24550 [Agrobacterium sp. S7/73]QYA17303.1 hypothetical protein J5284_32170 [Rhizobium sp. AB2/73]UEQ85580.1 hypothetical protein I8E17_31890 [Rhizobium sp. AB2/73]